MKLIRPTLCAALLVLCGSLSAQSTTPASARLSQVRAETHPASFVRLSGENGWRQTLPRHTPEPALSLVGCDDRAERDCHLVEREGLPTFAGLADLPWRLPRRGGEFIRPEREPLPPQPVAPVPEPGTYALMFAGLLLVGFAWLRKSSRH